MLKTKQRRYATTTTNTSHWLSNNLPDDHDFCGSSIESAYRNTERNGGCFEWAHSF